MALCAPESAGETGHLRRIHQGRVGRGDLLGYHDAADVQIAEAAEATLIQIAQDPLAHLSDLTGATAKIGVVQFRKGLGDRLDLPSDRRFGIQAFGDARDNPLAQSTRGQHLQMRL